jgi:hypothetical protein
MMYLCIPASSAASERLFSASGLTASNLRNGLTPRNLEALVMIRHNRHVLQILGLIKMPPGAEGDVCDPDDVDDVSFHGVDDAGGDDDGSNSDSY